MEKDSRRKSGPTGKRVALVSAPWPLFDRPSIQLGVLKAWLEERDPHLQVSAFHFFLKIAEAVGYETYDLLSRRTWLAESVYGALLHPKRFRKIEGLFLKHAWGKPVLGKTSFPDLVEKVREATDEFVSKTDWDRFLLAGFSVSLCQLTSSLYLAKKIKESRPRLPVVAGGSLICAESARPMLRCFRALDAVVVGEGEKPLARLVEELAAGVRMKDLPDIRGLAARGAKSAPPAFDQIDDLDALPPPDFSDYFDLLQSFPSAKRFFPKLPAEISRGCFHRARTGPKGEKGCAFCNLNLQWKGYRMKSAEKVVAEIGRAASKHKTLSVCIMDNAVPPQRAEAVSRGLISLKKDFKIFCELRAGIGPSALGALAAAGLDDVQIGVEALSTRLLEKMNKGVETIQNLESMKFCEALGIADNSNLLLRFPGSDEADVEETLRNLEFAAIYRPLKTVNFWLGLHSPVHRDPAAYGIKAVFNHPHYRILFPPTIVTRAPFMIRDYRGDKTKQKRLWKPVEKAVEKWKDDYEALRRNPFDGPILSYRDGGDFLVIRRRKLGREAETHRLTSASRRLYLFCGRIRSFEEIAKAFHPLSEGNILGFLTMMVEKKLMFNEYDEFLSLAVPRNRGDATAIPSGGRHTRPA